MPHEKRCKFKIFVPTLGQFPAHAFNLAHFELTCSNPTITGTVWYSIRVTEQAILTALRMQIIQKNGLWRYPVLNWADSCYLVWIILASISQEVFLKFQCWHGLTHTKKEKKKLVVMVLSFYGAIFLVQPRKLWLDLPKSANLNCWFSVSIDK